MTLESRNLRRKKKYSALLLNPIYSARKEKNYEQGELSIFAGKKGRFKKF